MNRHVYFRQQEKNELMHHGILGQKWGIRRYQNEDGSYTEAGKRRYFNGRKGYANRYKDYSNNAKNEYIKEKGGKTGYKKYYKEEYIPSLEKSEIKALKPKQLVDKIVDERLQDAYISEYSGLDEFYRDKYAKLTNDAIRQNTLARTASALTAAAGAMTFGVGIGVAPTVSVGDKKAIYDIYEKKVRYKDVSHMVDDPDRLQNKYGISKEETLNRINDINSNDKLIKKTGDKCLKGYKNKNSLDVKYLGTNIDRDNNALLSYAVYDKNDENNFELKTAMLDDKDKKVSYIETFPYHSLKQEAKETIHYVKL